MAHPTKTTKATPRQLNTAATKRTATASSSLFGAFLASEKQQKQQKLSKRNNITPPANATTSSRHEESKQRTSLKLAGSTSIRSCDQKMRLGQKKLRNAPLRMTGGIMSEKKDNAALPCLSKSPKEIREIKVGQKRPHVLATTTRSLPQSKMTSAFVSSHNDDDDDDDEMNVSLSDLAILAQRHSKQHGIVRKTPSSSRKVNDISAQKKKRKRNSQEEAETHPEQRPRHNKEERNQTSTENAKSETTNTIASVSKNKPKKASRQMGLHSFFSPKAAMTSSSSTSCTNVLEEDDIVETDTEQEEEEEKEPSTQEENQMSDSAGDSPTTSTSPREKIVCPTTETSSTTAITPNPKLKQVQLQYSLQQQRIHQQQEQWKDFFAMNETVFGFHNYLGAMSSTLCHDETKGDDSDDSGISYRYRRNPPHRNVVSGLIHRTSFPSLLRQGQGGGMRRTRVNGQPSHHLRQFVHSKCNRNSLDDTTDPLSTVDLTIAHESNHTATANIAADMTSLDFDSRGVLLASADSMGNVRVYDFDEVYAADVRVRNRACLEEAVFAREEEAAAAARVANGNVNIGNSGREESAVSSNMLDGATKEEIGETVNASSSNIIANEGMSRNGARQQQQQEHTGTSFQHPRVDESRPIQHKSRVFQKESVRPVLSFRASTVASSSAGLCRVSCVRWNPNNDDQLAISFW